MPTEDELIRLPIGLDFTPAEADIKEEQARLAIAFNKVPGLGGLDFGTIRQVVNSPNFGDMGSFRGSYPQAARALDRYTRFASTGQTEEQRSAAAREEAKQRKAELADKRSDARKAEELRRQQRQADQDELNRRRARVRSLSALGAFAVGGGTGRLRASLAEVGYTLALGGGLGETSLGAVLRGQRRATAPSLTATAAGSAANTITGSAVEGATTDLASSTEAAAAGSAVGAGLASTMTSLFWPALAIAAVAGVVNAGSAVEASVWASRYQLANAISGATGQKLYGDILNVAQATIQSPSVVAGVATHLGALGVKGAQVVPNTETALDLTRIEPAIPQASANQLVGTMATQGGQTPQQIGTTLDTFRLTSDATGLSLAKLTTNLAEFLKATNGVALDLRSLTDVLALQAQVGAGVNVLTATAPAVSATGQQALVLGGALGISQEQLGQEQQSNQARLYQQIGAYLRKATAGQTGRAQDTLAEMIGQNLGMITTTGQNPEQAAAFVHGLMYPSPTIRAKVRQAAKGASLPDFQSVGTTAAGRETSLADQLKNYLEVNALRGVNTMLGTPGPSTAAYGPFGDQTTHLAYSPPLTRQQLDQATVARWQSKLGGDQGTQTLTTIRDTDKELYDWLQRHEDLFTLTTAEKAILAGSGPPTSAQPGTGTGAGSGVPGKHPGATSPLGVPGGGGGPTPPMPQVPPGTLKGASVEGMAVPTSLLGAFQAAAKRYGIPLPELIAQSYQESGVGTSPNTVAGGGIGQFLPLGNPGSPLPAYYADANSPYNDKRSPFYHQQYDSANYQQGIAAMAWYDQKRGSLAAYNGGGDPGYTDKIGRIESTVHVVVEDKTTGGVKAHATVSHDRTPPGYTGTNPAAFIKHGGRR